MIQENGREPFSESSGAAQTERPDTPLPQPRPSSLLVVLLALALIYTLYFAKTLLLPLVVALMFALLLGPLVALFKRLYIPRPLSAVLLLTVLLGPFTILAVELAGPAQKWAKRLPELSEQLTSQLTALTDALQSEDVVEEIPVAQPEPEEQGFRFFGWFRSDPEPEPAPPAPPAPEPAASAEMAERVMQGGMELAISMLGATPLVLAQLLTTVILIIFLLVFGPNLFAAFVDHFPSRREKRQTIALVRTIQRELSRYILTVSAINACLGIVTGLALWALGVEDAALWGAVVGLANFAPYVGPILSMAMLALAGLVQYGPEPVALLPVAVYFFINLIEAQFVTPMVLGHNMRLNPLVIMVWLLLWGWLWGAAGVLLAVPLLVCLKLACDQLHILSDWVRIIETRA
ncbi:AI-2E family transporter [Pseudomonas sp.]|jgi:predicted PurR-regulated permease PerM|uniref:AI-2E family transporter n=1 Tax=Pseudomonas sp. TaxID=306 RepID=UPI00272ABBEA|nr:AI-2E family transporter [Pseudomonas sp.]